MRSLLLIITVVFIFLFSSIVSAESRSDGQREYPIVQIASIDRPIVKLVMSVQIQKKKKVKLKPKTPVTPVKPVSKATPSPAPISTLSTVHTANITYTVPGGSATVGFSVTARDGVIVSASSATQAGGTSGAYQDSFASSLTWVVIGKKTAGLSLSAIGGASLTTSAFERFVVSSF